LSRGSGGEYKFKVSAVDFVVYAVVPAGLQRNETVLFLFASLLFWIESFGEAGYNSNSK